MVRKNRARIRKYTTIILLFLVVGFFSSIVYFGDLTPTGKVILGIDTNYLENETLTGDFSLLLKQGEFIPRSSKILVTLDDVTYDYNLEELVALEIIEGDFFAEDVELFGSGEGFGVVGSKETLVDVAFTMEITKGNSGEGGSEEFTEPEETTEEPEEEAENNETEIVEEEAENNETEEIVEEEVEEETIEEEVEEEEEPETEEVTISSTTGKVVAQLSNQVSGSVAKGEEYTYELSPGETASIVSSDQDVELTISGNVVTVTTDYVETTEEGFGQDYLGDENSYTIVIDVADFNLIAKEGDLEISLQYEGLEIASVSTSLSVETEEEVIIESNVSIDVSNEYALTTDELFALKTTTGDNNAKITKAEVRGERLIIRFEIGNYWLENSYNYVEGKNMTAQLDLDKEKWLKRLSQSILESTPDTESLDELIG